MVRKKYWVYLLLCENGHFYTGITTDLKRRYQEHVQGSKKCKYTVAFKPVKIAQSWQVNNKSVALKMEYRIKQLSHEEKKLLTSNPHTLLAPDGL